MSSRTLDHFLITVDELAQAKSQYEKLGFHVRPIAKHVELGSSNCVIHFPATYLELICLTGGNEELADAYRGRTDLGEGLSNLSINSTCLQTDRELLKTKGFKPNPILSAKRKIVHPNGREDYTASSSFYVWREENRFVSLFLSEHRKPETIFIKAYEDHPNTVVDVTRVVFMSLNPKGDIDYFSEIFEKAPDEVNDDGFSISGARGEVTEVITVEAAQARYGDFLSPKSPDPLNGIGIAIHYSVGSMERCQKALEDNNVACEVWSDGRLIVPARHTCGVTTVFEPEAS